MNEAIHAKPQLSFSEALNKLAEVKGRSRRSEFWWCYLLVILINMFSGFIPIAGSLVSSLASLAIIPLTFRRLHDTGHSGWWYGAGLILSVVLIIVAIVTMFPLFMEIAEDTDLLNEKEFIFELMKDVFMNPIFLVMLAVNAVYGIVLFVFLCQDSQPFANKYGESPKYGNADDNGTSIL